MECKNSKKWVGYGHFAECNTRQRQPLPSAMPKTLGKAGKTKPILTNFQLCRVPGKQALGKEF
jgi:hypothetical protein